MILVVEIEDIEAALPVKEQACIYKAGVGEGVFLYRFFPPADKYFVDVSIYENARNALANHADVIDRDSEKVKSLNRFLGVSEYELGFGPYRSDNRIDIFSVGEASAHSYFEDQVRSFDVPWADESREGSLGKVPDLMKVIETDPFGDEFARWLDGDFPREFVSPAFRRLFPEVLEITPVTKRIAECLMWVLMLDVLLLPTSYDLICSSKDDVNPFTGGELGLARKQYVELMGREVSLQECISSVDKKLRLKFPVLSLDMSF